MPLSIMTNDELEAERKAKEAVDTPTIAITSLASYLKGEWVKARDAKQLVELRMLESLRRRKCEYPPEKLTALKQLFGSTYDPPFMPITLTKCIAAESWIKELLFQTSNPPYELQPTSRAELSEDEMRDIIKSVVIGEQAEQQLVANQLQNPDIATVDNLMLGSKNKAKAKIKSAIAERAKELARDLTKQIDDQLEEGSWYEALTEAIPDIITFPAGFIKGPSFRKNPTLVNQDLADGKKAWVVEDKVIPKFNRVSPFDIFPEPGSSSINEGYIFEKIPYTKSDLHSLKGLDGVKDSAIDEVLTLYQSGGLKEWTITDDTRSVLENKDTALINQSKIDCLEFWGTVDGSHLINWGLVDFRDTKIEETKPYNVCVWMIGNIVIRAILNPDPLNRKPYHKASWMALPGSFWGSGLPEVLMHPQDACNAVARATVLNAAFASGPIIEENTDRYAQGENGGIHPYKSYKVTNKGMSEAPAIRLSNAQLVADRLIAVYNHFSRIADEVSIPSYAHGDPSIGGAGRTASGLSMLMAGASKNVRNVLSHIDDGIISSSISLLYNYDLVYNLLDSVPDAKIIAKGSFALVLREQRARDITEFMQLTANPIYNGKVDSQKLLAEFIEARGMDSASIIKDDDVNSLFQNLLGKMGQGGMGGGMPAPTETTDPAMFNAMTGGSMPAQEQVLPDGQTPVAGQDTRQFGNGEQGPIA